MAVTSLPSGTDNTEQEVADRRLDDASIDTPRAFLGPNASYYDERWRWMDWTDSRLSWNWPAISTFGLWFAYRRLYGPAILYAAWFTLAVAAAMAGFPIAVLLVIHIALALALGTTANRIYLRHFQRRATAVFNRHADAGARERALSRAGGTSSLGLVLMALATAGLLVLVVLASRDEMRLVWL